MAITDAQRIINEGTDFVYKATLLDADSVAIPLTSIDSITLTLFDAGTGTIINSRDNLNVKNTNQVTIHATSGLLTWNALPADSPIVSTSKAPGALEQHIALFRLVYSGTKALNYPLELYVKQLQKYPS